MTEEEILPGITDDEELARIRDGYLVSDRRESVAVQQAHRWWIIAIAMLVVNIGLGIWGHMDTREVVSAFVQTIRVTDDGQVTLIEPPKPMREYVVPPEAMMQMLGRFVVDLRRIGKDEWEMQDRKNRVDAAVCGPAEKQILKPPVRDAALVAVNVETVMPTESSRTWRVQWAESWHTSSGDLRSDHTLLGDFTLSRRDLDWSKKDAMKIWILNPLSLCVSSYVVHEVPH